MDDRFQLMLEMQLELQRQHMKDGDPRFLEGDAMADFMRWNAFALEDEIHEAMQEVGWKPWAASRYINQERFMKEMVDGFHFFMNMLLCGCQGWSPAQIADEFTRLYIAKNAVNAQRQVDGYDGVSTKCQWCKRELSDVDSLQQVQHTYYPKGVATVYRFCNREHLDYYENVLTDEKIAEATNG